MRKMLLSGASALAIALGAGNLMADEMDGSKTWAGPYFGVHLGYGWVGTDGEFKSGEDDIVVHGSSDGLIYGAHAGYNLQSGNIVYGVEASLDAANLDETSYETPSSSYDATGEITSDIETLASVRLRLGYAMDNVLVYATGGVAYMDANFNVHDSDEFANFDFDTLGGVVGGGAEMRVSENVSFGLEGLYYIFDEKKSDFTSLLPSSGATDDFGEIDNMFVVRLRATYHF